MLLLAASCTKHVVSEDALYPESPEGLVTFEDAAPTPALAAEGAIVTVKVNGLEGKQFKFFINQTEAEVVSFNNQEVRIKIPITASTGTASVVLDGQYYFGPVVSIRGRLNIDPSFNASSYVADNEIAGILSRPAGGFLIYGAFKNYQALSSTTAAISGLALIDNNGASPTTAGNRLQLGSTGLNGPVTAAVFAGDKIMVGGSFSSMNTKSNINNITRLNSNGSLDTVSYDIVGEGSLPQMYAPAFNGGLGGAVTNLFNTASGIIAIGNFTGYSSIFYERSTAESPYIDRIAISQVARLKEAGSLDSSFNLNTALRPPVGYTSANGNIYDAVQTANGKILVVGNFTNFEGSAAGRIARIDPVTGRRDGSFSATANGSINRITYNANTGKILLTGNFDNYNGQAVNGVVMINQDGAIDNSFVFSPVDGGVPNYAAQLNDGRIIVSGSFNKYAGVVRPGFMMLNANGTLAAGYNNVGYCNGKINGYAEYASDTDPTVRFLMLVGSFTRFDGKTVGNIVKLRIQN